MSNITIRKPGAYTMSGGFNIKNIDPIDSRTYVNDINHIYLPENWEGLKPYPGLIVSDPTGEIRICVNSAYTATTSWLVVRTNSAIDDGGDTGIGTVTATTIEEANEMATAENVGLLIYVIDNALYLVGGVGNLIKINTSDADAILRSIQALETTATTLNNEITTLKENVITGVTYNGDSINITNNAIEVSGITNNYYTKNKIDEIVSGINETIENSKIDLFEVVSELPESGENNKVYLVPNKIEGDNSYTEYIYVSSGTTSEWEKIGEVQSTVNFDEYYTTGQTYSRDEISNLIKDFITSDNLNTKDVKLSESIDINEDNGKAFYTSGTSVQAILQSIHERIKQINSNIDSQISGITEIIPGTAVEVDTNDSAVSPKISVKIYEPKEGEEENAIVISGDSLYVKSLENRLAQLEEILKNVITTENIGDYAVTEITYGDTSNDISIVENENGKYTLTLNSITNIAYNDATEISE